MVDDNRYWLLKPNLIPDEIYEHLRKSTCFGIHFIIIEENGRKYKVHTFSPLIASMFLTPENHFEDAFWSSSNTAMPIDLILYFYWQGYIRGYEEYTSKIHKNYFKDKEHFISVIEAINETSFTFKKKCFITESISTKSFFDAGYNTGIVVGSSKRLHESKEWYKEDLGEQLSCCLFKNPVFEEIRKPSMEFLEITKELCADGKNHLILEPRTLMDAETLYLSLNANRKLNELYLQKAKQVGTQLAEEHNQYFNKTYPIHPKLYADIHAMDLVKNKIQIKITKSSDNSLSAQIGIKHSYDPPSYLTPAEFHFYQYKVKELYESNYPPLTNNENSNNKDSKKLSYRQYALLRAYQNKPIYDDQRAREDAERECGLTSENNGYQLYKKYIEVKKPSDRIGVESIKSIRLMIKDIESILHLLKGSETKQAENEILTLKAKIS